ncbi:type VI secretion system-associated protein TagF [Marinimicrobium sp. ARAG 43.8]|uniref:type VI secretion system-associated protein TagF n=1 Tax=Marinimicrobium sp. ARAG 43.8 TaxID=3418719 RepID=UPI003CF81591
MPLLFRTGIFGKLPAHGDFIHRDLSTQCINVWDGWLQGVMGTMREQLGDHWLDVYLTSPVWRFALSPGVIDSHLWFGISLPSVDRVGRYFPFTVLCAAQSRLPATAALANNNAWFESVESLALSALEGQLRLDAMAGQMSEISPNVSSAYQPGNESSATQQILPLIDEKSPVASVYPYMLDEALRLTAPSYSLWTTRGSDRVESCVLTSSGLPSVASVVSMYTGQWRAGEWHRPCRTLTMEPSQ